MRRVLTALAVMVMVGETGCAARLTAVPVSEKARLEMGATSGIPYYIPRPYLLVTRDIEVTDAMLRGTALVPDSQNTGTRPGGTTGGSGGSGGSGSGGSGGSSGGSGGSSGGQPTRSGTSSVSPPPAAEEGTATPAVTARPVYRIRIVYLPDLSRQYALQQRGGGLTNYNIKYELEGGWMFKGTEVSSETRIPETIEASTGGLSALLGTSLEAILTSLFPPPPGEVAGVSSLSTQRMDDGPRIWLFEIGEGPQGTLRINMEKPFFEWPPVPRGSGRPVVELPSRTEPGRDPDATDLPAGATSPSGKPRRTDTPPAPTGPNP